MNWPTHSDRFIDYLKHVLTHAAPLSAPKDMAWVLASYAHDAKKRGDADHDFCRGVKYLNTIIDLDVIGTLPVEIVTRIESQSLPVYEELQAKKTNVAKTR